jgi:hypothetical protein
VWKGKYRIRLGKGRALAGAMGMMQLSMKDITFTSVVITLNYCVMQMNVQKVNSHFIKVLW